MDYYLIEGRYYRTDELYHYGVAGMKWGVVRANLMSSRNEKLQRKALKYDAKSAKYAKKSEKQHTKKDLEAANRAAVKGQAYLKKAAIVRKKALEKDDYAQVRAEKKASILEYKAAKKIAKGNRISKTTGYGAKAMSYSIKSDKLAIKAAKARSKMAGNKAYITTMNKRLDSLDAETLRKVEQPIIEYIKRSST